MKEIIKKLKAVEVQTSKEKGSYNLFAFFLRRDIPDKWEVVVSANWMYKNKDASLKYLFQKLKAGLTKKEHEQISRIALLDEHNPALPALQQISNMVNDFAEIEESEVGGAYIKHAFLLSLKKSKQPDQQTADSKPDRFIKGTWYSSN